MALYPQLFLKGSQTKLIIRPLGSIRQVCLAPWYKKVTLEIEVTKIILAKVLRLCQLSSHSCGFLSGLLAHKTPSYDTKMLLKVVFDKTVLVKFTISNSFKQNIDEKHSKQPKIHRKTHTSLSLWILKI